MEKRFEMVGFGVTQDGEMMPIVWDKQAEVKGKELYWFDVNMQTVKVMVGFDNIDFYCGDFLNEDNELTDYSQFMISKACRLIDVPDFKGILTLKGGDCVVITNWEYVVEAKYAKDGRGPFTVLENLCTVDDYVMEESMEDSDTIMECYNYSIENQIVEIN